MTTSILDTPILDRHIEGDHNLEIAFATIQARTSSEAVGHLKSMIEATLHSGQDGLFETPKYPFMEDVHGHRIPRELPDYIPGDLDYAIGMLTDDLEIARVFALSLDRQFICFPNLWGGGLTIRALDVDKELSVPG